MHLLHELVRQRLVEGWPGIARELARIARIPPSELRSESEEEAAELLLGLCWEKVFDFCERLHGHLAQEAVYSEGFGDAQSVTTRENAQAFIASELQRLFLEEGLAFEFREGCVYRRGRRHSIERISRAEVVLGDPRLAGARKHFEKSQQFFRHPTKPDYENAIKEAVCAVEAAGKALFPDAKASTLGDLAKWLSSESTGLIPKALARTFDGLYGFRSGGEGVGHGGASGGAANVSVAEYSLAVAASQIILLVDIANERESEIPF